MNKKTVFGNWEAVAIVLNVICTKIFLNFPRLAVESAGSAVWLFTIFISFLAFLLFMVIQKLYKPFAGKSILEVAELAGGRPGRIITGLAFMFYLGWVTAVYLRTFSENMKLVALTTSPLSFVELFFLSCMIAGAYFGIEAISRFHALAVPAVAVGFLLIMLGVTNKIDLSRLAPILGIGLDRIFLAGSLRVSIFSEFMLLFLLYPFLKTHKHMKTSGYWALGLSSFFLTLSAIVYVSVFPFPVALERTIPIFHIARLIKLGRFVQRVEAVFVLIWAAAALLYVTVNFYFILHIFQKTFGLEHYKPLIIPFAILIMNISFLPPNLVTAVTLEVGYFRNWSWIIAFAFPIVNLAVARARSRKRR